MCQSLSRNAHTQLKHFLTLFALLVTSLAFGQEECCALMDYNGDRNVTISDFTIFLSNYGGDEVPQASPDCILCFTSQVFDADQQGEIGLSDLLIMLSLFGSVDVDSDLIWDSVDDCFDVTACNFFEELATECIYIDALGVCDGECQFDIDEDGLCDDNDGCSDPTSCNFLNPSVIDCTYPDALGICGGECLSDVDGDFICDDIDNCTDLNSCNYNEIASCGCTYIAMDGNCSNPEDIDGDGICNENDSCSDVTACNYATEAPCGCCYLDSEGICYCDNDEDSDGICNAEDTCGNLVPYQGYDYETIQIGNRCWFAENLRNTNFLNGESIPSTLASDDWANTGLAAQDVYGLNESIGCSNYSPIGEACDQYWSLEEYLRIYNW